ncbi:MAG: tRNA dihydrouridine synthase DusB [Rickettsiaceae bacterium]
MSIFIGNVEVEHNVILAPMSGVTDLPFRKLVKKFCNDILVVSEMIASRAMIEETKKSMQKCAILSNDKSACVQIAGCDPEIVAIAAKMNEDMGAKIIDLNFGCPAKKIVNNYAGSALMRDEKLAAKIIESAVKAVKVPVTLKMRVGWDDSSKNAPKLAKIAQDVGVQMITVHGRTRCQFYSGKSDWKFIRQVKESVDIPVIANGDVKCIESAKECLSQSGADGIMIGRGIYGKPWLIKHIIHYLKTREILDQPTRQERLNIILEHYNSMLDYYGAEAGIRMARKHLCWYSNGLSHSNEFRKNINFTSDPNQVIEYIYSSFA